MRSLPRRERLRPVLLLSATLLLLTAGGLSLMPSADRPAPRVASVAERLGDRTWALAIPAGWLAVPLPGARDDDVVDLLGTRPGERATATEIASGLRVISSDDRALVVELTAADAASIASARARGMTLVPILRSLR